MVLAAPGLQTFDREGDARAQAHTATTAETANVRAQDWGRRASCTAARAGGGVVDHFAETGA